LLSCFLVRSILQEDKIDIMKATQSIIHRIQGILIMGQVSAVVLKLKECPSALDSILKCSFFTGVRTT
jgi:hypothetical protein